MLMKVLLTPLGEEIKGVLDLSGEWFTDSKNNVKRWLPVSSEKYDGYDTITRSVLPIEIREGTQTYQTNPFCHLGPHNKFNKKLGIWEKVKGAGHWRDAEDECQVDRYKNITVIDYV